MPNMASFQLESVGRRWFIFGCYLIPDYASTIEFVVLAINQRPHGDALLVAGDFDANLAAQEGNRREEDIAASMATTGLEYMTTQFFPCHKS